MHPFFCKRAFNTKYWKKYITNSSTLVGSVVAMIIVINYVIGGLSRVHLIWLADVTVWFQVSNYSQLSDFTVQFQPGLHNNYK